MINVEGIVLPNKPLTNFQLIEAAKKLKIKNFRGVFVRDELPKKPRKKECGIVKYRWVSLGVLVQRWRQKIQL